MRLGAQSEDYATLIYMSKFSERSVETVGWCKSPKPGWGASPDGIVLDPSMTWAHVDQSIAQYYTEDERNPLSIQKGVLEIKTSAKSLSMADYYYPQLYVEMFATRALWCDLVRYRQQRTWDERTRSWTFQHRARIYRVYRHRPTEEAMFRLIQYALSNRARLQQVVHEDSNFLEMRAHFRKLAAAAPYTEVDAPLGSPLYEQLERYRVEKEAAASAPAEAPPFPLEGCRQESEPCPKVDHTAWLSETGARQHQIARLAAGGNGASSDEVARLLVEQIQAHARVLEKLLM